MEFQMSEDLTGLSLDQLSELLQQAEAAFDAHAADTGEGKIPSAEALAAMKDLNAAADAIAARIAEVRAEESGRLEEARGLIEARSARAVEPEPEAEEPTGGEGEAEVVAEAETIAAEAAETEAVTASANFKGLGRRSGSAPADVAPTREIGFRMQPNVPKFQPGIVGYRELALALNSMAPGSVVRSNRGPVAERADMVAMSLATLDRDFGEDRTVSGEDAGELEEKVNAAVRATNYQAAKFDTHGALVASGGWCASSETIYTFCDVPPATDLISLPDLNITRGGLRWPAEPDFTALYASLPFRFTEAELVADPAPTKPCVEIPCPTMEEIRAEAIGLCITAGILQKRGWPELIERFMKEAMKAHQIKVSVWSILDMVAGSTAVTVPAASTFAAVPSFLNSVNYQATVIRQIETLAHNAVIEGVAPTWMLAVAKDDLAYHEGRDPKSITDAQVDAWLADRNIRMQWVGHWQQLDTTPATTSWPATVQVLLYPQGTWFRHLANVIEVGTLYDKAQLQQNRYTELFTEDEYKVARRCNTSRVVTIPICANGAIGNRTELLCGTDA